MRFGPYKCFAIVVAVAIALLSGCARQIRAVEWPGQVVLSDGRAALQQCPLAEVLVRPVAVPWASRRGPVGFHVELTNTSDQPLLFELDGVELQDAFGHVRRPIPPDKLLRSFGLVAEASPGLVRTATYRVYRRHHFHWSVGSGFGAGWYGYPYWHDTCSYYYDSDPYYEWEETARFLSELADSHVVEPGEAIAGHVLFAYAPEKDDELTLSIPVFAVSHSVTSRPAKDRPEAVLITRFEID